MADWRIGGKGWVAFSALVWLVPATIGCSGASMVLKTPIVDECSATGLRGCPDIAEGMLLYVDGDKAGAAEKLARGAAHNSPAELQKFAEALAALKSIPGADAYLSSISEALDVMAQHAVKDEAAGSGETVPADAGPSAEAMAATSVSRSNNRMLTADTDPAQALNGVVGDPESEAMLDQCTQATGGSTTCRAVQPGPAYLTDLESLGLDCAGHYVAVYATSRKPRFVIDGPFRLHGARLLVREGEFLVLGQYEEPDHPPLTPSAPSDRRQPDGAEALVLAESDPRYECNLLWSGFKPYPSGQDTTSPGF